MILRSFLPLLLLYPAGLVAQSDLVAPDDSASSADAPMNLRQNFNYTVGEIFGPATWVTIGGAAAIDHIERNPGGWGSNSDAYALRFASRFGHVFVRENIALGIRALDGEDPRYRRSGKGGLWRRAGYAVGHTFTSRNRNGGLMPAWSTMVAAYSTPFIAQQWRPDGTRGARELTAGSVGVGFAVGENLGREFGPDFRKGLRRRTNQFLGRPQD